MDEVGELGPDEQAMLLRALEEKLFLPVGADEETGSSFQLICGSNRDLNGAVVRMATMSSGGRITVEVVEQEIGRLQAAWRSAPAEGDGSTASSPPSGPDAILTRLLGEQRLAELDRFDRVQLADVVAVCSQARSLSEAGRILFAASRQKKENPNDADRVRKHLLRFGLSWQDIQACASKTT
jgi:transcriptional regulatory protein RtcR